ncbi:MAG TPA: heparan-alpha-glucosaminide N-acetyltransferase domain-containing protein, partial [Gemmatimonadales bacterium]|nr:heparan-alpha-glucosaminide N-acetyltransferase domain-containing protein [Gemmatimonadales bacterium]
MSASLLTVSPATSPPASRPAPLAADERIHALDILRGLALFGMILVHFHQKMRLEATGFEDLIGWGVYLLVEQKAWGTFAFLFGVGFDVLLRRLEGRGAPVTRIYLRRLGTLALFGIVADVGFGFRILTAYAAWGLALLVLRRWSTRALLAGAALAAAAAPLA